MIPKKIHYCWFGRNPKPKLAEKCIKSWKKYCPDYEIIEWNEDNFDIDSAPLYVRQAYEVKKWAFVSDYARLKIIYDNGGIYFDTDVEVVRNLDAFLKYKAFFGFERISFLEAYGVASGLGFGAEKGFAVIAEMMNSYHGIPFIKEDGSFDELPSPTKNTEILLKHGLTKNNTFQIIGDNIAVFPSDYLCPLDWSTKVLEKTENTHTIHWYSASWWSKDRINAYKKQMVKRKINIALHLPGRAIFRLLGKKRYDALKKFVRRE